MESTLWIQRKIANLRNFSNKKNLWDIFLVFLPYFKAGILGCIPRHFWWLRIQHEKCMMVDSNKTDACISKNTSFGNAFGACQNRKVLEVLWHRVNFVTRQLCNVYVTLSYVVIFGSNPKIMLSPNLNRNVRFCIFRFIF